VELALDWRAKQAKREKSLGQSEEREVTETALSVCDSRNGTPYKIISSFTIQYDRILYDLTIRSSVRSYCKREGSTGVNPRHDRVLYPLDTVRI
jgi:hypothetical protein